MTTNPHPADAVFDFVDFVRAALMPIDFGEVMADGARNFFRPQFFAQTERGQAELRAHRRAHFLKVLQAMNVFNGLIARVDASDFLAEELKLWGHAGREIVFPGEMIGEYCEIDEEGFDNWFAQAGSLYDKIDLAWQRKQQSDRADEEWSLPFSKTEIAMRLEIATGTLEEEIENGRLQLRAVSRQRFQVKLTDANRNFFTSPLSKMMLSSTNR